MIFFQRIRADIVKRKARWETLCKKCGICCYGKESSLFRTTIHLSAPCEFFNPDMKLCRVYEKRFSICKYCGKVTIYHALFSRSLPATCGYVEKYRSHRFFRTANITSLRPKNRT